MEELAPELVHEIAFGGWLGVEDVRALSETCKRMAEVLVWDEYGRDLCFALGGVVENVSGKRWKAARYAAKRGWYGGGGGGGGGEEGVWKKVLEAVCFVDGKRMVELEGEDDLRGWEEVVFDLISSPKAGGVLSVWRTGMYFSNTSMCMQTVAGVVGSVRLLEWGLERGMDVEVVVSHGTPLTAASRNGHGRAVALLLESGGCDVGKVARGKSALMEASIGGHAEVVYRLLMAGGDVWAQHPEEGTSLHAAAERGYVDVVTYLLEWGADYDAERRWDNATPMFLAAREGHLDVCVVLEEAGADVDKVVDGKPSPLGIACRWGCLDVVVFLLECGARVDEDMVVAASVCGHDEIVAALTEATQ